MPKSEWKSGTLVKIKSCELGLRVVGYDSVGSVICEYIDDDTKKSRLYVAPTMLTAQS